jgi:hypothetical protein
MAVTEVSQVDRAAILAEVERLTQSSVLHGSEALCRLLRYLAAQALAHPGAPVKEYQLATEVFGRPADFDPRMDSTVRVQTGRLRSKLAEYYPSVGADDPIVLEIPKGSYSLVFHYRAASQPVRTQPASPPPATEPIAGWPSSAAQAPAAPSRLLPLVWILGAFSVVCAGLLVMLWVSERRESQTLATGDPLPEPLKTFWAPFLQVQEMPWIIFSNAEFIGKPQVGIRYFDPTRDSKANILDHYTGVGEVLAVAELSRIFTQVHREVRIKRGRLLSLDDVKNNNVIFIGSLAENLVLREIPTSQDFVFRKIVSGSRAGDVEIANLHPRPGEASTFQASDTLPIEEDYALIGLVPGLNRSRSILVLAGTTTMGTQAAAEFVCRSHDVDDLLKALSKEAPSADGKLMGPFEAVIQVRVSAGVPVKSTIVTLHRPAAR